MKISHGTRISSVSAHNGYGYATVKMIESLQRLGHTVEQNDKTADVEIWFDQPQHWKFSEGPYKIGYHPWESTLLNDGWAEIMNQCDEIWTPSPLIARWYREYAGVTAPIYVYEHGVENIWKPAHRRVEGTVKFLHVGAEAARKGFRDTATAFRQAFTNGEDVEMNFKLMSEGWKIGKLNRMNYLNGNWPIANLVRLYHDNHVFVYPSYGEGFGLAPLQALATGMPTITVPAWAPYAEFLDPALSLSSRLVRTPYERFHPGMMLQPDFDELVDRFRYAYENYEAIEATAYSRVEAVAKRYDWDTLTAEAFNNLAERLSK